MSSSPAALRVLILGSGGREHALAVHLVRSASGSKAGLLEHVYVAPGNGGTMGEDERISSVVDVAVTPKDEFKSITSWAVENKINLCIPGPEQPLVDGVEAAFRKFGIPVFGPSPVAAQMEGSKTLAKAFMARHNIPTAAFSSFGASQLDEAAAFVAKCGGATSVVLKASGLAAGKGVLLPETEEECAEGIKSILVDRVFGDAGESLLIEERLEGPELSILTFSDGYSTYSLPCCQDHKRIGEGDKGPNTGGMGAYAPAPEGLVPGMTERIEKEVIQPSIAGMRKDGFPFVGLLFTGLMLTKAGPQVLEYNVRFGDPETEAALELIDSQAGHGLAEIMLACVERRLDSVTPRTRSGAAVSVVLASGGYPGKYVTGVPITIGQLPQGVTVYHAGTKTDGGKLLTAGGRVLVVAAAGATLEDAVKLAYSGVDVIKFEGMTVRRDIAHRALGAKVAAPEALTYAAAGVDVDAGNALVEAIKPAAKATRRPGCDASLGGFGGVFDLKAIGMKDPVLVSGTDGVGTKLRVALDAGKHDSVGIDLVAMSVNDLLVQGAQPLYFLDYFACSKLDVPIASAVIGGVAEGCKQSHCGLIGGETAEMPGMYIGDDYDLAGFAVGAVERSMLLPRVDAIKPGDVLLGLTSSGVHSNGFSLVRRILERSGASLNETAPFDKSRTLAETLLAPTRIYVDALAVLLGLESGKNAGEPHASWSGLRALSHITGGGFTDNIPRVLPKGLGARIDVSRWARPALFAWLAKTGNVEPAEMCRTFNNGIGMVLVVAAGDVEGVTEALKAGGEKEVVNMGVIEDGEGVRYNGFESWEQ